MIITLRQEDNIELFLNLLLEFQRYLKQFHMIKEDQKETSLTTNRFYRYRPTMLQPNVIGPYLIDFESQHLQIFHLKDFSLFKRIHILSKQDCISSQIKVINQKLFAIYSLNKFVIFNVDKLEITKQVKLNCYIEKFETRKNYIAILSSDEEAESKVIYCWEINNDTGDITKQYQPTLFTPVDFEECQQDTLTLTLIISIEGHPKVYAYWKDSAHMIEIDPRNQIKENYTQSYKIQGFFDLTNQSFAQIVENKVIVKSKKTLKPIAHLMCEDEKFTEVFSDGTDKIVYTLSNLGLKRWKLETNSGSSLFISSNQFKLKKLFFRDTEVIGFENNTIIVWKNQSQYSSYNFPSETVRRVLRLNEHQVFFLLEAHQNLLTPEGEYEVSKYNKLQIFDFSLDNDVVKKIMLKSEHTVDVDSIIINDSDTIRFVVDETGQEKQDKKYIIKWTPFTKDENGKDTKRKQIKGANSYDIIKLYPFNKILGVSFPKKLESFSLFANTKEQKKSQVTLFDYNAKKVGDYDFPGDITNVELSEKKIFTIAPNKIVIFNIDTQNKNRLEKINELGISAISLTPFQNYLLIKKEETFILLDSDFECILREQSPKEDKEYKVIPSHEENKFFLKTETSLSLWDTQQQQCHLLKVPNCAPHIMQVLGNKILIADKWVQAYDIQFA